MDLAFQPYGRPAGTPTERRRRRRTAVLVTGAVVATAVVGSVGVRADTAWFRSLRKPAWYPPDAAFPIAWTALYATIAWASTRALNRAPVSRRATVASTLGRNLVLNAGWTWTFFRARRPGLAVGTALALDASTVSLIRAVGRHDRAAGAALLPYLAWTVFATALTEAIWFRNSD
ncbi:TspO/MBR family protein [Cellulomonas aerilata]|uniref:Tryptophan-rich sensory protein n=1 Tax=Cellulomonas aerilata TaxID=515326 RepID=A0A512DH89_9CELL|nr:TspO/MBR family protein [Cellulomonas aerilata]GEO35831.1 tryptophan-rich sensory protein [Cellulomonas aerilata]